VEKHVKVLIADDHPIFRAGLVQVISNDGAFKVVAEASNGVQALALLQSLRPEVAVVDIDMPEMDGLQLARALREKHLATRLIFLTMHKKESFFNEAMDLGVSGYVLKDNAVLDILQALRTVAAGECYLSPIMSSYLVTRAQKGRRLVQDKPALGDLTAMERRVLGLIADNKTSKEIAAELFISPLTVETHRRNICQKLELHGSHRLLQFALQHRSELPFTR
jgi:DNA-binding NarL/FixJ family response regulator